MAILTLLMFGLMALSSSECFAKEKNYKKAKQEKMTYNEYINEYGKDKTSITLINLFFDKRDNAGIGQMSFLPLTASIAVVYPPVGVALVAISCPLFVSGLITRNNYSHKKLISALDNYKINKTLPIKLENKVTQIHLIEQEIFEMDMEDERFASLQILKD